MNVERGLAFGARWPKGHVPWAVYALALTGLLALLLKVLPAFDQDDWVLIGLLLPMNLGLAAGQWLRLRASGPASPAKAATQPDVSARVSKGMSTPSARSRS